MLNLWLNGIFKKNILGYYPQNTTYGSAIKVWWICENGHEWEAQINSRNKGAGCKVCYRLKRKSKQQYI